MRLGANPDREVEMHGYVLKPSQDLKGPGGAVRSMRAAAASIPAASTGSGGGPECEGGGPVPGKERARLVAVCQRMRQQVQRLEATRARAEQLATQQAGEERLERLEKDEGGQARDPQMEALRIREMGARLKPR